MAPRYIIRTIDEDWIDLFDPPSRIDGKRPAWDEAKHRVCVHPECKTVVIDRYTGVTLWQSDPDIPPQFEVVSANRTYVYAIDDRNFPVDVLSSHKEKDDAWTAFYEAIAQPFDDIVLLRDTTPARTVIASSDDDTCNTDAA